MACEAVNVDSPLPLGEEENTNTPPVADAGRDQNVQQGTRVTLDGSASIDADANVISYSWQMVSMPNGSTAQLSNANVVNPNFVADVAGIYELSLIVSDAQSSSLSDSVLIVSSATNSAPVANAGADQNVSIGSTVRLNGSQSSDANNDVLSFSWSIVSAPNGSSVELSSVNSVNPSFVADLEGLYVMSLVVNDGQLNSDSDRVVIASSAANSAPVANAGFNQNVSTGSLVTLNGSQSSDADGDSISYAWGMVSLPNGSSAQLNNINSATPSFTADVDGVYVVALVVSDGQRFSQSDNVTITSATSNSAPVANAGTNQNVLTGSLVTLDGSQSSDADNDSLSYAWTMATFPTGSSVVLGNVNSVNASFTPDVDGEYVVNLVVNDGQESSQVASVVISSSTVNSIPVANAGSDQNVSTGSVVNLDGSLSSDADGDNISYAWGMVSLPNGSSAQLNNINSVTPSFTADTDGTYVLSLVVNDGQLSSEADSVVINSSTPSAGSDIDDFAGNGSLIGYTTNNPESLPDVARVNGRYRANLVNNSGNITLHYNNDQGRLDAKQVTFPFEVIARNIGIGTQSNSQTAPSPVSNNYIFAGIQVHVLDLQDRNSSHLVVGHRGSRVYTVEGKNTIDANSTVDDEGANAVPDGRADIRIVGNADGTLTAYWQQPVLDGSADNWLLYRGTGNLPSPAQNYGAGATVYVGLITYAQGGANIPFVGTCDSFEIIQN